MHLTNISLESKFSTYASSIRWHYGYIVPPYTTYADSVVPGRTQQLEASDQGLHSLLAEMSTCCLQSNIWAQANNIDTERTPQAAASDQGLHSLLAEMSY